ncbi:MAG: hypothetical protein GXP10_04125 [Gammaproteobacteria bacterium]|nr:hypothetical protein [Gammaproteobacteria bacterium]
MSGYDAAAAELVVTQEHPGSSLHHGDHCCHGAAHLIAIICNTTESVAVSHQDQYTFSASALPYLYISLLLRPPIV